MYYHLKIDCCPHCLQAKKQLCIGHSSAGWAFALNVFPKEGINGLDDWERLFFSGRVRIEDDLLNIYSPKGILAKIRGDERQEHEHVRHREVGDCIEQGDGFFDLVDGEERTP